MNRMRGAVMCLGAAIIGGSMVVGGSAIAAPDDPVTFEPGLAACVNAALGQSVDATITEGQAARLTELNCTRGTFTELTGIGALTSLQKLDISNGMVLDISPLRALPALTSLTALNMHQTLPDIPVGEWQPNPLVSLSAWFDALAPGFTPAARVNGYISREDPRAWVFHDAHAATPGESTLDWSMNNYNSNDPIQYTFSGTITQSAIWLPPTVQTQPSLPAAVLDGSTIELTSTATSNQEPRVRWQVRTPGEDWTDLPGAATTTLPLTVGIADDGNEYRAVFTTDGGSTPSGAVTLNVVQHAEFTSDPAELTLAPGGAGQFRAEFVSDSAAPNYTWEYSTDGGTTWQDVDDVAEADDVAASDDAVEADGVLRAAADRDWYTTLDVTGVTRDMDGWLFRAVVWDEYTERVPSQRARLTVSAAATPAANVVSGPTSAAAAPNTGLARTGSDVIWIVAGALGLMGVGAGVLVVRRRRAARSAA